MNGYEGLKESELEFLRDYAHNRIVNGLDDIRSELRKLHTEVEKL